MAFVIWAVVMDRDIPGTVCPDLGWTNSVKVLTTGSSDPVSAMTACQGNGCVPTPPSALTNATPGSSLTHDGGNSWTLNLATAAPAQITVQAYDADGKVLTKQSYSLNWTRVGGNEVCGGPMTTAAIEMSVP